MAANPLFLSYSRKDQDFALRLAADLREAGLPIWVDQIDIRPSQRWDRITEGALRQSSAMVLVLSPRSTISDMVLDEIAVAADAGKIIIPVMMEAASLPLRIARLQFIDATGDYALALERVKAAAISAIDHAAASPAALPVASSVSPAAASRFAPALIEALSHRLTVHLGPIARHLVEDESRGATDFADLVRRLAGRIPNAPDRSAFLAATHHLTP
jgi:TIR domain